jgi:hypothetical protein
MIVSRQRITQSNASTPCMTAAAEDKNSGSKQGQVSNDVLLL